jgi:hypothetical protein
LRRDDPLDPSRRDPSGAGIRDNSDVRPPVHRRLVPSALVLLSLLAGPSGAAPGAAQAPARADWTAPRTPWGDPDLQGTWTSDNNFSVPLERPAAVADRVFLDGEDLDRALASRARLIDAVANGGEVGAGPPHWYENLEARSRRSSLIIDPPDGRLPALTAEAKQRNAEAEAARRGRGPSDSWADRSLWDRCITVGLPAVMFPTGYNNNVAILQAPGYVTITHEMMHDTRVMPLDGRPHLAPAIRGYMGDSRAHWEGATLVIDITNFHPATNYRGARDTLHLVERYTRTGPDQMQYEVTIDDPHTFEQPWTAVLDLEPQDDIYEYACHEGNRGLENILRAARLED